MIDSTKLSAYKEKLEALREQLARELEALRKPAELGDENDAFDTEADEAEEFSANAGMAQSVQERHEAAVAALGKLEQGTYGVCESCKKEIEPEILDVNPESRLCLACKAVK